MPLFRRVPKRGFTNIFAKEYAILNVEDLNRFDDRYSSYSRTIKRNWSD